ncbi:AraC family transcriptional regulator [Pseudomonas vanderleydeniana]|uniref:Helix-turn-helix transcriptional regulator n=1 Tax=Pseudomonas vanderleydeniana TaxID=2745495 RepID=A0A9E6PGI3_9PSED|nr:response regulator transcription factor [Pseudomonas vanderleydeniana]QXI25970.1 helix-turn-helix transcriptional regulator [Pseudomonas vanderleydeniana]
MAHLSPKLGGMLPEVFRLELSESTGYAQDWHAHDCHMLLLPRQGGLLLSTESNANTLHVSRQGFSLVPADFAHSTQAAPGREKHLALYIDPRYIEHHARAAGYAELLGRTRLCGLWQGSEALESILHLHDQLARTHGTEAFQRQLPHLNHLLFEECARLIACQQPLPQVGESLDNARLVRDIQTYVREHLLDELDVDSIGYQFHLSRRHLTRLFKSFAGETLVDFTNRTRVETAARLISSTSLSILEVSLAVGLDSPSYLARLFKRYLGLAPRDLRKPH